MSSLATKRLVDYLKLISEREGGLEALMREPSVLENTDNPKVEQARAGLEKILVGNHDLNAGEQDGLEAIVVPGKRPAIDIVEGDFLVMDPLWRHLDTDAALHAHIKACIPSIGRIELPGHPTAPYGGTGFVVGKGLLMTNRHVAGIFADGVGETGIRMKPGRRAGIDFRRERDQPVGPVLEVRRVRMVHPYWDMALLEVDGLPDAIKPLKLSLADTTADTKQDVVVIGYPAFDPRNARDVQDSTFGGVYGVKRLQPGWIHGRRETASFGKLVPAAAHDCSTLGGNSGSAVIDPRTGEVLALHFGGRYLTMNYGVPAFELARDGRVVSAGVNFAGTASGGTAPWSGWWDRESAGTAGNGATTPPAAPNPAAAASASAGTVRAGGGEVTVEIPLQITVRLGIPAGAAIGGVEALAPGVPDQTEKLVEPWHDGEYSNRRGYDPGFLGIAVPMPDARDPGKLAPVNGGGTELRYQNFSLRMHAARRIALVTAANVTAERVLKEPERGRNYGRKVLGELTKSDQEKWFPDPRIDLAHQLSDAFFTRDGGMFDKGHIVRRDDVAWGATYDLLKRANGDTFHVTNCSPQVAGFNQSARGEDNWGDLENHVLSQASSERLCVFAGPVLTRADQIFIGVGGPRVKVRVQIPARFWKVIVARVEDGIASYGFVLEQDLTGLPPVEEEFIVPENFSRMMVPLFEIERAAGVVFAPEVREADQYADASGAELAMCAGLTQVAELPCVADHPAA